MITDTIRQLHAEGLSPAEIAEALQCEPVYVKTVLGVGLTDADEAAALDMLRGTLNSPFAKEELRVNVAKFIFTERNKAMRSKAVAAGQNSMPGNQDAAAIFSAAMQKFLETAGQAQAKHELTVGIRITTEAGTSGNDRKVISPVN